MFEVGGFFFPEGEKHFPELGDAVASYGKADRDAAYRYVKRWRRALDVGANVGLFSRDFASRFEEVVAFEPVPTTRECLIANVPANVRVEPFAIAEKAGSLKMYRTIVNSGASFICNHPDVTTPPVKGGAERQIEVQVRTIDSYGFDAVDLIKLDIQGAEHLALLGGRDTILRHKPVILVEQKAVNEDHAGMIEETARMLSSWGMVAKEKARSDRVFIFED